ncbi:hypothetical protein ACOME3_001364 [Neoechinorhynchus agilis]
MRDRSLRNFLGAPKVPSYLFRIHAHNISIYHLKCRLFICGSSRISQECPLIKLVLNAMEGLRTTLPYNLRQSVNATLSVQKNETSTINLDLLNEWDNLNYEFKCCGYDGFFDWTNSTYGRVPTSCVTLETSTFNANVSQLYYKVGCRYPVSSQFSRILMKSGIVAVGVAAVQVICIVASLANYSFVRRSDFYV